MDERLKKRLEDESPKCANCLHYWKITSTCGRNASGVISDYNSREDVDPGPFVQDLSVCSRWKPKSSE